MSGSRRHGAERKTQGQGTAGYLLPERTRELKEITGGDIACEIDWPSFQEDFSTLNFTDNVACHRLNMALRMICIDDLGKEAARDGLHKVRISNVKDKAGRKRAFEAGVLTMSGAYAEGLSGAFSDREIRELMTAGL